MSSKALIIIGAIAFCGALWWWEPAVGRVFYRLLVMVIGGLIINHGGSYLRAAYLGINTGHDRLEEHPEKISTRCSVPRSDGMGFF